MTDQNPSAQPATRRWPFLSLAAAGFVLLITVGPFMATSQIDASGSKSLYSAGDAGMLVAREAAAQGSPRTVLAIAEAPPVVSPQISEVTVAAAAPAAPPDEPVIPPDVTAAPPPAPPIDGGAIEITMSSPAEAESLRDGDTATWEITLTNTGDEYLWGVYAYMEGYGIMQCDQRQLAVDASSHCRADHPVWAGEDVTSTWVTAWTANRMVEDETSTAFRVGG